MRKITMRIIAMVFIVSCFLPFGCGDDPVSSVDNTNYVVEDDFSFNLGIADQTALRLEGVSGAITIIGRADFDSVIISGTMRVGSETIEDAEEHMQYLDVEVVERDDEIYIRTDQPGDTRGRSYVVDYNVIMPRDFASLVTNVNGIIAIDSTVSGIQVNNVNGQIFLTEVHASASASLVNGQIFGKIYLPLDGAIVMSTVNGGIQLSIPQSTSAEFEAGIVNGGISILNLDLDNEVITTRSVTGTLGDGEGNIDLSAVNGNVVAQGF